MIIIKQFVYVLLWYTISVTDCKFLITNKNTIKRSTSKMAIPQFLLQTTTLATRSTAYNLRLSSPSRSTLWKQFSTINPSDVHKSRHTTVATTSTTIHPETSSYGSTYTMQPETSSRTPNVQASTTTDGSTTKVHKETYSSSRTFTLQSNDTFTDRTTTVQQETTLNETTTDDFLNTTMTITNSSDETTTEESTTVLTDDMTTISTKTLSTVVKGRTSKPTTASVITSKPLQPPTHIAGPNPFNPHEYTSTPVKKNISSGVEVEIKVSIYLVGQSFSGPISDISSREYQELKTILKKKLAMLYKSASGFVGVDIDSLSDGSGNLELQGKKRDILKVDYRIITKPFVNTSSSVNPGNATLYEIKNITSNLKNIPESLGNFQLTRTEETDRILEKEIVKIKAEIKITLCGIGYEPDEGFKQCTSKCADYQCLNGGMCLLTLDGDPICSCRPEENFVYTGRHCDVKTEQLKLEKTYIIAIAGGSGGLLCIIMLIVCVVCVRRGRKAAKDNAHVKDDQSIYNEPTSVIGEQRQSSNLYIKPNSYYEDSSRYDVLGGNSRNTYSYIPPVSSDNEMKYGSSVGNRSANDRLHESSVGQRADNHKYYNTSLEQRSEFPNQYGIRIPKGNVTGYLNHRDVDRQIEYRPDY